MSRAPNTLRHCPGPSGRGQGERTSAGGGLVVLGLRDARLAAPGALRAAARAAEVVGAGDGLDDLAGRVLRRVHDGQQRIDARLEASEGLLQVSRELRVLNDSLNAVAYAALGQSPQVRRRAG